MEKQTAPQLRELPVVAIVIYNYFLTTPFERRHNSGKAKQFFRVKTSLSFLGFFTEVQTIAFAQNSTGHRTVTVYLLLKVKNR